jgi:hypothetical protein
MKEGKFMTISGSVTAAVVTSIDCSSMQYRMPPHFAQIDDRMKVSELLLSLSAPTTIKIFSLTQRHFHPPEPRMIAEQEDHTEKSAKATSTLKENSTKMGPSTTLVAEIGYGVRSVVEERE